MRMALSGHQFLRTFANAFGTAAALEGAVIQEELQQAEVRCAQLTTQEEVIAQPRVEISDTQVSPIFLTYE